MRHRKSAIGRKYVEYKVGVSAKIPITIGIPDNIVEVRFNPADDFEVKPKRRGRKKKVELVGGNEH